MCNSKKFCAVLMKTLCSPKVFYLVAQGCRNVNSSKNGRFRYEMIGERQPEMELLEAINASPLFAKSRWFTPICNQNLTLAQHRWILRAVLTFS